jgi:phage-related minor tail protein
MRGEATPEDILKLRELFEFNRAPDNIKLIRRQVERYEHLIQQQAENEARAKFNDEQAKQLKQEAETVKGGK